MQATPIRFVGLATGYGSAGFFRLWGTSDAVQQTSRTLSVASGAAADADAAADPTLNAEITVRGRLYRNLPRCSIEVTLVANRWRETRKN